WWAWASYAWLTNTIDPGDGLPTAVVLLATGALFIAALAVPHAFGGDGVLFGVAFLVVSVMQATLYMLAARGDEKLLGAVLGVAPGVIRGAGLILVAGFFDGALQAAFWIAAIVAGFVGPGFANLEGWRLQPGHFVERHGLIVIIAIGESLVAIGFGANEAALSASVILAAVLGLIVATSF